MDLTGVAIRPAEPEEAAALCDIAMRAKASHGYDASMMEAFRAELSITRDYVADHSVFVIDERGRIGGFYALVVRGRQGELDALFVEPSAHGRGFGRLLWDHAVSEARALGCTEVAIQADPFAEAFYAAMGAERVGERESGSIPGRMLPLLQYAL